MIKTNSVRGHVALMVGHCAGMVDLVALPVWVGTLISRYGLDPQQAGLLATLFLAGAVVASLTLAPRFHKLHGRTVASLGFAGAALAFFGVSMVSGFASMAVLHAVAGLAAGSALSVTHGTIARSERPHRMFAIVGMALGVFGIVFLGATPPLIAATSGPVLFIVFASVMLVASLVSLVAFPVADAASAGHGAASVASRLPAAVWFGIVGIGCMGLVQAMTFSFLERVGSDRGFGARRNHRCADCARRRQPVSCRSCSAAHAAADRCDQRAGAVHRIRQRDAGGLAGVAGRVSGRGRRHPPGMTAPRWRAACRLPSGSASSASAAWGWSRR